MATSLSDTERRRRHDSSSDDEDDNELLSPTQADVCELPPTTGRRTSSVTSSPNRNRIQALKRTASVSDNHISDEIQSEHSITSENMLSSKTDLMDIGDGRPVNKRAKGISIVHARHTVVGTPGSRRSSRGSPAPHGRSSSPLAKLSDSTHRSISNPPRRRHPLSPGSRRKMPTNNSMMHTDPDASDSQQSECYTASPPSLAATPDLKPSMSASPLNQTQFAALPALHHPLSAPRDTYSSPASFVSEPQCTQTSQMHAQALPPTSLATSKPVFGSRPSAALAPYANTGSMDFSLSEYSRQKRPWAAPASSARSTMTSVETVDIMNKLSHSSTPLLESASTSHGSVDD
eukprot:TRINITY_DN12019_c1_g6_i12.p1 TRINITY_DN12019_c1_g6~~TRINITY_DN12019_c1_g6_i12.p1  ORF type:complete len:347 (+),score=34.98 TRINITY_DN12019_c1_g6_i12:1541-2581(+)